MYRLYSSMYSPYCPVQFFMLLSKTFWRWALWIPSQLCATVFWNCVGKGISAFTNWLPYPPCPLPASKISCMGKVKIRKFWPLNSFVMAWTSRWVSFSPHRSLTTWNKRFNKTLVYIPSNIFKLRWRVYLGSLAMLYSYWGDPNMSQKNGIQQRVLGLCRERQITAVQLAHLASISQSTLHRILSGDNPNPEIKTIKKLCDALDITLGEFFSTPEFDSLEQEIR